MGISTLFGVETNNRQLYQHQSIYLAFLAFMDVLICLLIHSFIGEGLGSLSITYSCKIINGYQLSRI